MTEPEVPFAPGVTSAGDHLCSGIRILDVERDIDPRADLGKQLLKCGDVPRELLT